MKIRKTLATAILASQLLATLGLGITSASAASGLTAEAQARAVVTKFFQTINARQFEKTCDLLAVQFYRENHLTDKARCALALRIGFTWAPSYRFRIVGVRVAGHRAVVEALANGAPGEVMLVQEHGRFRVVSVGSK